MKLRCKNCGAPSNAIDPCEYCHPRSAPVLQANKLGAVMTRESQKRNAVLLGLVIGFGTMILAQGAGLGQIGFNAEMLPVGILILILLVARYAGR